MVTIQGMNFGTISMNCGGHPINVSASNGGPLQMNLVMGPPTTLTESNPTPPLQGLFGFTAPSGFVSQPEQKCSAKTTSTPEGKTITGLSCKQEEGSIYVATATLTSYSCLAESNISCTGSGTMQLEITKDS